MPVKPGLPEKSQRISVVCSCGKKLVAGVKHSGKQAKCPACGEPIAIPSVSARVAPPLRRAKSEPSVAAGNRRPVMAHWSLSILVVIGATAVIYFVAKSKGQSPFDVANAGTIVADKLEDSQAIREIEGLGGRFVRDDKLPGRPVTAVGFRNGQFEDKNVQVLVSLKNLKYINLDHTQITDAGLKKIVELKNLSALDLTGTKITDAGLKELQDLKQLTTLSLAGTKIADSGLKEFKKSLPNVNIIR
jgi:Leucine-rich repeat (LRR) protein